MKVKWKCTKCNSVQTSDSKEQYQMDYCSCGACALDLEEGYSRVMGGDYYERIGVVAYASNEE